MAPRATAENGRDPWRRRRRRCVGQRMKTEPAFFDITSNGDDFILMIPYIHIYIYLYIYIYICMMMMMMMIPSYYLWTSLDASGDLHTSVSLTQRLSKDGNHRSGWNLLKWPMGNSACKALPVLPCKVSGKVEQIAATHMYIYIVIYIVIYI